MNKIKINFPFLNEVNEKRIIQIFGDTDSCKTFYILDFIKVNQDLSFLYIDTSYSLLQKNIKNVKNMTLFRSNNVNDIIKFIQLSKDCVDIIIIDNILFLNTYDDEKVFSKKLIWFFNELIKNMDNNFTFAINGTNDKGEPLYEKLINSKMSASLKIEKENENDNSIKISIKKYRSKIKLKQKEYSTLLMRGQ